MRRWAGLWLAVVAAAVCIGAVAASASAGQISWNCGAIPANSWCISPEIHTYDDNEARYAGSGNLNICAKLTQPGSNPEFIYARDCQFSNSLTIPSNLEGKAPSPNGTVSMNALVANGNNCCAHTIDGIGDY